MTLSPLLPSLTRLDSLSITFLEFDESDLVNLEPRQDLSYRVHTVHRVVFRPYYIL